MKYSLLFVAALFSGFSFAQTTKPYWKSATTRNNAIVLENKKGIVNPNLIELDLNQLQQQLATAPKRFESSQRSNVVVAFPTPDGIQHFAFSEMSNMDPALAARFPEIKSYMGVSLQNRATIIYISLSPLGLQTMMVNPDRSVVLIEPYTTDAQTYVLYRKADKTPAANTFECKVMARAQVEIAEQTIAARPNADDGQLRTYRLALSVTGEYTAYFGGTKPLALAAMNNTMTRVNAVFEMDFGVHMNLIAGNDALIYTNAATDPYSAAATGAGGAWNTELQNNLTNTIGNAAYDIGHLFGASGGGGNAGCIGCVCVDDTASTTDENKGSGYTSPADGIPSGDNFDIDYVVHEMGHQFGANHTFTHSNEGTGKQMEPGSGSTIMGYAGITSRDVQPHSDPYFHAISVEQVTNYIKTTTCQTTTITGNAIPTANAGLDYTIPKGTPFMLTGSATDANGDTLTYDWEQMNSGTSTTSIPNATKTSGPNFRSYNPTTSPVRYFPKMSSVLAGATTTAGTEITVESLTNVARNFNFRLTVRDNRPGSPANNSDDTVITVNATAGPFAVTVPNTAVSYAAGSSQTITWSVAGTTANNVNCANVDILLSTDGGNTFPITLLAATPNDGSEAVTIPNLPGTTNRIMIKGTNHIFFDVSNTNFTIAAPSNTVSLKLFIEGYYNAVTHAMQPVQNNAGLSASLTDVIPVTVELRNPTTLALAGIATQMLQTNGTLTCSFPTAPAGLYYIVVKQRNSIETWSSSAQPIGNTQLNYDFSSAASKAFGANLVAVETGVYALYSGDINVDGNIDNIDFSLWETDASQFAAGDFGTDLNGDGNVDNIDFSLWESNSSNFISTISP
ncbi:MAG TPA: M12 family metallo-peptidase [Flavobacterium sp.]|nr:M12 family metallo-peptidase [Flavobacterium sp.]